MMASIYNPFTTGFTTYGRSTPPPPPPPPPKKVEYAEKEQVVVLQKNYYDMESSLLALHQDMRHTRNDLEQLYQALDVVKYDNQRLTAYANYLESKINEAPSVAKRKRRVTICANGQVVEVCKHD